MTPARLLDCAQRLVHRLRKPKSHTRRNLRPGVEPLERRELLSVGMPSVFQPRVGLAPAADYAGVSAASLSANGSGSLPGRIAQPGQVDLVNFTAPVSGRMTIHESAAAGSTIDSYLRVFDAGGQLLAQNDDDGLGLNSRVEIDVIAGQTYYAGAAAFGLSTGDFTLAFSTAATTAGPTATALASAVTDIPLSAAGAGSQSGQIAAAGGANWCQFTAPVTGQMTIRQVAASGSRLDSVLSVYDSSRQTLLAQNDDDGLGFNSRVTISVTAGVTYTVKAAAYGASTGGYTLQFATMTDDFGDGFSSATPLTFSNGTAAKSGRIDYAGDVDVFSFTAPNTGQLTISQSAASGSQLDSFLYIYDSSLQLTAYDDDANGGFDSQVTLNVTAGQTYTIKAAAFGSSTGVYTLTVAPATPAPAPTPTPTPTPAPAPAAGSFHIDLVTSGLTSSQQQIIQSAADRWDQIIVGDLPDVQYNGQTIDDLQIQITATPIDGVGRVLGQSAPTRFRSTGSQLPYLGFIQLDTADVAAMQANGSLLGVIEHEMAHVLGVGVLWQDDGLLAGVGTSNPIFVGANATAQYNAIFGTNAAGVPVEATGGSGTALAHSRESTFNNELMTGWYNSGQTNPLSRITVASLADLGYQVNLSAADAYTPPGRTTTASLAAASNSAYSRDLAWAANDMASSDGNTRVRQRSVDQVMTEADWLRL